MDFLAKLKGFKKYYGMDVSLMKGDEILDTLTISDDEGSGKKLMFETEESKEELFGGEKTAEFKVVFTDQNGDDRNFRKGESNLFDLDPDEQTETTILKAKKNKAKIKVKLQGDKIVGEEPPVVEPPVVEPPVENETGDTINLTTFQDVYDDATGTTVNANGVQTERNERLSSLDNQIVGTAGELGVNAQLDSLSDPSTSDNDTLTLATNAANNLEASFQAGNLQNLSNIENIVINANNDNSVAFDFSQVSEADSIDVNGVFTDTVVLSNFFDATVSTFDFSGSTNAAGAFVVDPANNAQAFSNEELTYLGSAGADTLIGSIAAMTAVGGAGNDTINGSTNASSLIEGGTGADAVNLTATNGATDTVIYDGITNAANDTDITGFIGFNNNAAAGNHDKVRFDASTYSNYSAGVTANQRAVADVFNFLGTPAADNVFLFDDLANVQNDANVNNGDLSAHGKSWLLLDNQTGQLFYAADGNFNGNEVQIGSIDDFANFVSDQNVEIV